MRVPATPEDAGLRLDVFLARRLPTITRSHIQSLNRSGAVRIDGRVEKSGYTMKGGEVVEIDLGTPEPSTLEPVQLPLHIYYEDDDLAVIEKPAGLTVHPGAGTKTPTLVHGLLFHFKKLSRPEETPDRPGIVHRIDKWTSGLLIIARNDRAHVRLSRAFQDRLVRKTYLALVHGRLRKPAGEIALNIGRHASQRTRMTVTRGRGRTAHTSYRVVEEFDGFSLLEVEIKTGRTHQIRVHLSAIGHPVAGDNIYGAASYRQFRKTHGAMTEAERHFLHAATLAFDQPSTGRPLQFSSPLPDDFVRLLERLRARL
jgi:23S rRNA pseudouridine1911/1915/1917 synthase